MEEEKIYEFFVLDLQGGYVKRLYEHQAQAEMHVARLIADENRREQIIRNNLIHFGPSFIEKPYAGCEGHRRTCKAIPPWGNAYCDTCINNINDHIFRGIGTCEDCAYGGCVQPIPFDCAALNNTSKEK